MNWLHILSFLRILESSVLFIGLGGPAAELCKNVVLTGVGKVSLIDDNAVRTADLATNFFLRSGDEGQKVMVLSHWPDCEKRSEAIIPRLQELNPLCHLHSLSEASITDELVGSFTVVVLSQVCQDVAVSWLSSST